MLVFTWSLLKTCFLSFVKLLSIIASIFLYFALSVAPHILPFTFREDVEAGQLVQVSCAVIEGDEPMSLQWYKDGMLLMSSSEYLVNNVDTQLSLLLLRKVNDQHRGTYTCLAMNPVGSSEYSAHLNVKGTHILSLIRV